LFHQVAEDAHGALLRAQLARVYPEFWFVRRFVRVVDAGEILEFASAGLLVEPLGVPLFAHLDGRVHEHFHEEKPGFVVDLPRDVAVLPVRGYEARHGDEAGVGEELRHFAYTADVFLAVFGGKAQVVVEPVADVVAVKDVGEPVSLDQGVLEGESESAFTGGTEAGEPDGAAALLEEVFAGLAVYVAFVPG